jgi:hypothetical protein
MANSIERTSVTKDLLSRYSSDRTGGAFDAKKAGTNTAILGLQGSFGYTQLSKTLTIEPGFTTGMNTSRRENFTDAALSKTGLYRVVDTVRYKQ